MKNSVISFSSWKSIQNANNLIEEAKAIVINMSLNEDSAAEIKLIADTAISKQDYMSKLKTYLTSIKKLDLANDADYIMKMGNAWKPKTDAEKEAIAKKEKTQP